METLPDRIRRCASISSASRAAVTTAVSDVRRVSLEQLLPPPLPLSLSLLSLTAASPDVVVVAVDGRGGRLEGGGSTGGCICLGGCILYLFGCWVSESNYSECTVSALPVVRSAQGVEKVRRGAFSFWSLSSFELEARKPDALFWLCCPAARFNVKIGQVVASDQYS
mmetsp:Transcript_31352/g.69473  ORF Transcript_31352/g.69473 Transcript_31352/m.69473 type:complete len:167 (-) Transcript_31352:234-734(-)